MEVTIRGDWTPYPRAPANVSASQPQQSNNPAQGGRVRGQTKGLSLGWGDSSRKTSGGGVGVTLPFLVIQSMPWENGKLSTLASRLESIWEEGGETSRALLSTCPLLPQDQKNNRKNRTSAWRAPRARREEGAKDGCRAERGLVLD